MLATRLYIPKILNKLTDDSSKERDRLWYDILMKLSLDDTVRKLEAPWLPIELATFNNQILRIAIFKGEYEEHTYEYDEFFLVHQGKITITTENGNITLNQGEGTVIPRDILHKPIAEDPALCSND